MILRTESYKKGILLSTFFNILNKGLTFANSLIVAYYFGTQLKTDIYFYAFNTVVILSAFITSLNSSVLIPESMRLRTAEGKDSSIRFLNFFLYGNALLTILICCILFFDPVKSFRLVSDFNLSALEANRKILLLAAPLVFLMPVVNLLADILTSYKYFTIPMLAGIINGIFSICFVIIFHNRLDVLSLLTALIFSYTVNLCLLVVLMRRRLAWNFRFVWTRIEKRIWSNIGFAQAGNISSSLSTYLPLYLLSGFSTGIIAALNYAQQVAAIPTTLITNQFSAVTAIRFNELTAEKNYARLNELFLEIGDFLVFILMPLSGIVFLYSDEIVALLFHRGAFDQRSVALSARFLKYLVLLLPMLAINTIAARLFMAEHLVRQAFWYQVTLNSFLIVFIYTGIHNFGIDGYFIALLSIYFLSTFLQDILMRKHLPFIEYRKFIGNFLVVLVLNFVILICTYWVGRSLPAQLHPYLRVGIGGAFYLFLLLMINNVLKINKTFAGKIKTAFYS